MMLTIETGSIASSGGAALPVVLGASSMSDVPDRVSRTVPPITPGRQGYYWTEAWQAGERAALADLAAGRSRVFSDPLDAVRWLLSDDA